MNAFPTLQRVLNVARRRGIGAWLLRVLDHAQRSTVVRFCALVWLLIFCVPSLRRLASLSYTSDSFFTAWRYTNIDEDEEPGDAEMPAWMHDDSDDETINRNAPKDDRIALIAQAEENVNGRIGNPYDDVLRRFPNDAVVVSGYLRQRIGIYGIHGRRPIFTGRAPRFPVSTVNLPKDWNASIAVARRAQTLEPRNAFFDLALVTMLIAAKRDEEAYRVLETSSRKPQYDDHTLDAARCQLQQLERARELNTEEKALFAMQTRYKTHNRSLRDGLELLTWQTWRDEQKANSATFALRSLQRRASIARISAKMLVGRQVSSYDFLSTGNHPILNAWRTSLQSRPPYLSPQKFSAANDQLAQGFEARARALKQPEIAAETERISQLIGGLNLSRRGFFSEDFSLGVLKNLANLRWLARTQIALCIALYLLLSLAVIKTGADGFSVPASRKIVVDAAVSTFITMAFLLSSVLRNRYSASEMIFWRPWFLTAPFISLLWGHWKLTRQRAQLSRHNALQSHLIEYSKRAPLRKIYDFLVWALTIQVALLLLAVVWNALRRQWYLKIPLPNRAVPLWWSIQPSLIQLLLLVLLAFLLTNLVVSWRWLASPVERNFSFPALRGLRRSSGQVVAVAHGLFLLSIVAALPTQAFVNQRLDNYWRNGNAWLVTGFTSEELLARLNEPPPITLKNAPKP